MLYDVALTINYFYQQPSGMGRNLLRLMPRTLHGRQRLIAGQLATEPAPEERREAVDFFGNAMLEVAFRTAHDTESFRLQARVECFAASPVLDLSPPLVGLADEISDVRDLGGNAPHHFLGDSGRVRVRPEMTAYARDHMQSGMTVLGLVQTLGAALYRDMRFDAEATKVDTDPAEAFKQRHGVCQDFSQIMIAALRGLGVPAGYVSGFLRTTPPAGQPRLAGADAMHAWVRVWCGVEMGWVEYDPTNAVMVAGDHIVVAIGRDYDDVAPVTGILRMTGRQRTEHKVDVLPLD